MKPIANTILSTILLISLQGSATAQYVLNAADAQYELFNYTKAIDLYEQAYKKKASLYTAEQLAVCNALIHDYKQTESWYAIAAAMKNSPAANMLNYARALQSNSKYGEAKAVYQKYLAQNSQPASAQSRLWVSSCDSALKWMQTPVKVTITNMKAANSLQSDWGAVPYQDGVVFVSDRSNYTKQNIKAHKPFLRFDGRRSPDKKNYGWTGNAYQRLYLQQKDADSAQLFPLEAGTAYHVGPVSFTSDGNEIYFAMTRIPKEEMFVKGIATIHIETYSCKKDSLGKWERPVPFKYNNVNAYSVGDPFISNDGTRLYFVSDMPGGAGGTDLYICLKNESGGWDTPVNLEEINTEGNERSPYEDADHTFYFSSDGHTGMGGLDIFRATRSHAGKISNPVNLGYPFNSPQDDFAYRPVTDSTGYFSSNRVDGSGSDDIYSFLIPKTNLSLVFQLSGTIYSKRTHIPLANAIVSLRKKDGNTLKVETDNSGTYKFDLETATVYSLTGEKTNFRSDATAISTFDLRRSTTLQYDLYLEEVEIDKAIRLENIYYDFDKWDIRMDATAALDKLVKIMQDNETIWVELGSHTDSRGNDPYNMILSQKRAESAVAYIISRGINRNRIEAKGYGETQLLNKCANGIQCSPLEHQLNRRTEFRIVRQ